jgi:hypothetical protein
MAFFATNFLLLTLAVFVFIFYGGVFRHHFDILVAFSATIS